MAFRLTGQLDGGSAILLASPHSGTALPAGFRRTCRLPAGALRRLEDAHVGRLLAPAAQLGIPLLEATHARAAIDLNRAEDEIDTGMFEPGLALPATRTDRVRHGYGLFPRIAGADLRIHDSRLSAPLADRWIATLHRPWHGAIARGLAAAHARHGHALLLDTHSMPTLEGAGPATLVLGDRHGRSAAPMLVDWLHAAFEAAGLRVARNRPYAGAHTLDRHGRPAAGVHAVQLEFDRALYMDPASLVPHGGFASLAAAIATVLAALRPVLPDLLAPAWRQAAE